MTGPCSRKVLLGDGVESLLDSHESLTTSIFSGPVLPAPQRPTEAGGRGSLGELSYDGASLTGGGRAVEGVPLEILCNATVHLSYLTTTSVSFLLATPSVLVAA